jgi:multidrug resistance efflux pump
MKKNSKFALIVLLAALSITACSAKTVEEVTPTQAPLPAGILAEGKLQPKMAWEINFKSAGQIAEVHVADGALVKAGDVLITMVDSPEQQAAVARARLEAISANQELDDLLASADLSLAQGELDYETSLAELDKAQDRYEISDTDKNKASLDVARATLGLAKVKLEKLKAGSGVDPDLKALAEARVQAADAALLSAEDVYYARSITAPMDGTVAGISVEPGNQVLPGQLAVAIVSDTGWLIKTDNLTELDVIHVSLGQGVEIVLDALPDTTFHGVVQSISHKYEEKRGDVTYTVTISLTESDPRMLWGMTAAVYFAP